MRRDPAPGACLTRLGAGAPPVVRLVVAHHAGASHAGFRTWARHLPRGWELCLLDVPGRARARALPPAGGVDEVVRLWADDLAALDDTPYAVFGHSMGAALVCALVDHLRAAGAPGPRWVGVSAHTGRPSSEVVAPPLRSLLLPGRRRGAPSELRDAIDVIARARVAQDMALLGTWSPPRRPLDVPLTGFCGGRDPLVAPSTMCEHWSAHSSVFRGVEVLDGDHFYFVPDPAALLARVVREVEQAVFDRAVLVALARRPPPRDRRERSA